MTARRFIVSGFAAAALVTAQAAQATTSPTSGGSGPTSGTSTSSGSSTQGTSPQGSASSGGAYYVPPPPGPSSPTQPMVTGFRARIIRGLAYAPSYAPMAVKQAIWAGDRIRHKPYIFGGGHGAWAAAGYDCSGSVSYVLHSAGLLTTPMDSSELASWGESGLGHWITVYTNPGHAFIQIAGIRFDTSALDDPHPPPGSGPRWRPAVHDVPGFQARHLVGL